jgi:hypothetical protein
MPKSKQYAAKGTSAIANRKGSGNMEFVSSLKSRE